MLDPSLFTDSSQMAHAIVSPRLDHAQRLTELADESAAVNQLLAATIEIQAALDSAESLVDASQLAAGLLKDFLTSEHVIVCWRASEVAAIRVVADSDTSGHAASSHMTRMIVAAAEEIAARGEAIAWPPDAIGDRFASLAVAQLVNHLSSELSQPARVVGVCLSDESGRVRGVLIVANAHHPRTRQFISAFAPAMTSKLVGLERLQRQPLERIVLAIVDAAKSSRRDMALLVGMVVLLVLLVPMPYTIRTGLEMQPMGRRFVAAPFDGPLDASYVRPGDAVAKGDLLARINPRELEYELARVQADLHRSLQEKKGFIAGHEFGASRIAELESESLQLQVDLLRHRRDNLEILSPLDGIVISGDWQQREGIPLARGEMLFEISPSGEMIVELEVPEVDVEHVRRGQVVEFFVNAMPERKLAGTIDRVRPRAELRDHNNVFIAELHLADELGVLRPGMKGTATIYSDKHPVVWNVFHKAWFAIRNWIGI